jgi:hypothetical protein
MFVGEYAPGPGTALLSLGNSGMRYIPLLDENYYVFRTRVPF